MAGRLDPPHDRVTLSRDEVRTLIRLERALYTASHDAYDEYRAPDHGRHRPLGRLLRGPWRGRHWVSFGLSLVAMAIVLILFALASPVLATAFGVVTAVGVATCVAFRRVRRRGDGAP